MLHQAYLWAADFTALSEGELMQGILIFHLMEDSQKNSSNTGAALVVWIAAFAASWTIFLLMTGTTGLALVFSVFVALIAFDLTRRSLKTGLVIFVISLFVVILQGSYYLLA